MSELAQTIRDANRGREPFTYSLFFETMPDHSRTGPFYTLKEEDHRGYPSMKRIYMECADVTEYRAAMELLGSWRHWKKLTQLDWFREKLDVWREELEVMVRSRAIASINGDDNFNAKRWIAEKKWETKRGRPSKSEVARTRRVESSIADEVDELFRAATH